MAGVGGSETGKNGAGKGFSGSDTGVREEKWRAWAGLSGVEATRKVQKTGPQNA